MLLRLFCYGTLCVPEVMRELLGRSVQGEAAVLPGFICRAVRDKCYPAIVPAGKGQISGIVYTLLKADELAQLDPYEGAEYRRQQIRVITSDGRKLKAWAYVFRSQYVDLLSDHEWSVRDFRRTDLQRYLQVLRQQRIRMPT